MQIVGALILPSFEYQDFHIQISLAGSIRLLAVAIYGWIGVFGIVLGWFFGYLYGVEKTLMECLYFGFISGFAAFISVLIWQWYFRINNAFEGLTSLLAIYLVFICALISSLIRYIYLASIDPLTSYLMVFAIGFVGDILGSFFVLYAIKGGLYFYRQFVKL